MSYSIFSSYDRCIVVLGRTKYLWLVVSTASGYHDTRVCREELRLGTSLVEFLEDASRCGGDVVKGVFHDTRVCREEPYTGRRIKGSRHTWSTFVQKAMQFGPMRLTLSR